jgi:hypothetical protein
VDRDGGREDLRDVDEASVGGAFSEGRADELRSFALAEP